MKKFTELLTSDRQTVYVNKENVECVLPHSANQSCVIMQSGFKIYVDMKPTDVLKVIGA